MTLRALPKGAADPAKSSGVAGEVHKEILRLVSGIEYGSVEIVIHGGQIVQIETREKKRFDSGGEPVR